ncbi:MAG: HAD family hydrolase [Janthinobacterium lividum]
MPKAIIFDVDGTLIDSVDQHARAWQDAFAEIGHEIALPELRGQIGKGGDQLMPVFLSPDELDEQGEALEKRRGEILKQRYLGRIEAFPDVRALFERIRADGTKIILASSAKSDELKTYKKLADIGDLIDAETTSDDAEKSKPHPDIFQAALAAIPGLEASDAIVVGDTPYDAEAAAKAGLRSVGVLCGGFPEAGLREAGCIAIFADPAQLLAQYADSPLAPG